MDSTMIKIGFIDYYLDEWHAQNYPAWINRIGKGRFEVAFAYGDVEGFEFGAGSNQEYCDTHGIELVPSIDAVIANSDALIVLSPDNPEEHIRLSEQAIRSGKPLYIDKTFSNTTEEAVQLFAWGEESNSPMFSASALRYSEAYQNLPVGEIHSLISRGSGTIKNYSVHQIEPIVMLLGGDIRRATAWGDPGTMTYLLEFTSGKSASMIQSPSQEFAMDLNYGGDEIHTVVADDNFFDKLILEMLQFFEAALEDPKTAPPVKQQETIAIMRIRELLMEAERNKGQWIHA